MPTRDDISQRFAAAMGSGHSLHLKCRSLVMSACNEETVGLLETRPGEVDEAIAAAIAEDDEDCGELSVVQFGMQMYFCTEDEGEVEVQVVRLGNTKRMASFNYETKNG